MNTACSPARYSYRFIYLYALCLVSVAAFFWSLKAQAADPAKCTGVSFSGVEIICLSKGLGSLSLDQRLKVIENKLEAIAQDYSHDKSTLRLEPNEDGFLILSNNEPVLGLYKRDFTKQELETNGGLESLAKATKANIAQAIELHRDSRSSSSLLKAALFTLLATVILVFFVVTVSRLHNYLEKRLLGLAEIYEKKQSAKLLQVIPVFRLNRFILTTVDALKYFALFFCFYFYVPLVLSFFPWTAKYAPKVVGFVIDPFIKVLSICLDYAPNIFNIVAILLVTRLIVRVVKAFFDEIAVGSIKFQNFHCDWAQPTYLLVKILIYALALVMVFPYLPGSSSPAFQGLSVFFGVLVSFGSGSSIANVISGIVITYMRPFKIGDRVRIADTQGDVIEKNFLVTRIRTIKNVDISIPNSMVLGSHIVNYSSTADDRGLILNTTVTIGYDAPWRDVHRLLMTAADNTPLIEKAPKPFVLQTALNDFYVSYELNATTRHSHGMAQIYSDLHQNIQDAFNQAGVEIMSPHYAAYRDGNEITIPKNKTPRAPNEAKLEINPLETPRA